jgi:hypothetical protein
MKQQMDIYLYIYLFIYIHVFIYLFFIYLLIYLCIYLFIHLRYDDIDIFLIKDTKSLFMDSMTKGIFTFDILITIDTTIVFYAFILDAGRIRIATGPFVWLLNSN